jgi:hypothetical protein
MTTSHKTDISLNKKDGVPGRLRNPPRLAFGVSVWVARPHTSVASLFAARFVHSGSMVGSSLVPAFLTEQ